MFSKAKRWALALWAFWMDFRRHVRYAAGFQSKLAGKDTLRCRILLLNHQLEKAQTYANPRPGYGKEKLNRLLDLLELYTRRFGPDELCRISMNVLRSHFENSASYKDEPSRKRFAALETVCGADDDKRGGVFLFDGRSASAKTGFRDILEGRRSCRQYAPGKIDRQAVREAVLLAMHSPSACNRQMVRVHYYDNPETIRALVLAQRSDTQWCLDAPGLFVITANEYYYRDRLERTQRMFDAGLFSMSLDLALHSLGIASCFKMAQKGIQMERDTKRIGGIPDEEDICVLLVAGYYPAHSIVTAQSPRLNVEQVLTMHP